MAEFKIDDEAISKESLAQNDEKLDDADEQSRLYEECTFNPDKQYKNLPLIVIVGRPNVGKSTLFNRLLHKRRAITDPTPGVTRDPIEERAFINGKPVKIMDTGGFKLERKIGTAEAVLDDLVVKKTLDSLEKADTILFLLDAEKITAEDEEFIALLRPYWNKVVAAVNKCEGGRLESEAYNFYKFGFNDLIFISAEHGDNIPLLMNKLEAKLDFSKVEEGEEIRPIRVAIVGKPNTGKSTLSNRLTHSESSIVSDYAGTTRDVVEGEFEFKGKKFQVLDTAGIRRKVKVKENIEYYSVNRAIKSLDRADIVFYLIDAEEGLTEQDKKVIALSYERGRGIIFVLNKWDTQEQSQKAMKKAEDNIRIMFAHMSFAPIVCISALEGKNIALLLNTALEVYEQLNKKIETSVLNTALKDWTSLYPMAKNANCKIKYIVQTSTNPVIFLIFASKPQAVQNSYLAFLKNKIRSDLGFDKIPVMIDIKGSRKRREERGRE